jgi:hypothetical protein
MTSKLLLPCALALGLLTSVALAVEITVAGSTTGSFSSPISGLTFTGGSFGPISTVGGVLSLSPIGSFTAANSNITSAGETFTLTTTFTAPATIAGGPTNNVLATITGTISGSNGGLSINFNNSLVPFTFSNPDFTGSFTYTVPDLFIQRNSTVLLTAGVTGSQTARGVPDGGSTVLLLGSGMMGLVLLGRRKFFA